MKNQTNSTEIESPTKIKAALIDYFNDLFSTEVALVESDKNIETSIRLVSYSKISFEGDTLNLFDRNITNTNPQLSELHRIMMQTSIRNRASMINMIIIALFGD